MQPAYVLHRRSYSDSSLLVDLFTLDSGRISVISKGAKTGKKRKSAILQPFIPLVISVSGRGQVKTLNACEAAGAPIRLEGQRLYCGFYLNELLVKFLHQQDPDTHLFALYMNALEQLADGRNTEQILRYFELGLLEANGLGLNLDIPVFHENPDNTKESHYYYDVAQGILPVETTDLDLPRISAQTVLALQLKKLENPSELKEAKHLLRYVIQHHLHGYEFKSRLLFRYS